MNFRSLRSGLSLLSLFAGLTFAVPSAFSQTMTITAGQGQLLAASQLSQPLQVLLLGSNGQPLVGAPVTFSAIDSYGGYVPSYSSTVLTDTTGTATNYYVGANLASGAPPAYDSGIVTASYLGNNGNVSVNFYETTYNQNQQGGALVSVNFTQVNFGQSYNGPAGSTSNQPFQLQVSSQTNYGVPATGVPNVAVYLTFAAGSTGSLSCLEGNPVLTNSSGIAICTPVYGAVGSGSFTVSVGSLSNSQSPLYYTVTVGPPALIQITSGNNQSGTPGKQLPLPLVAVVTDLGGNPTPNIAMAFTSTTPGGATFTNVRNTTDSSGRVSASVILGSVPGNISITLADTGGLIKNPAVFTESVNLTITGISANSGNNQSAFINSGFSTPLTVTVTTSVGAVSGTPVTFAVTSGSATLSNGNTTTNSNGQASTNVTAGNTAGPVVVTATSGQYSVTFNLTVIPPGPSNLTFTNGASGVTNSMSPGTIVTIYGSGIASNIQGVTSGFDVGPLPLQMAGVTVQFGSIYAPIFDVGNVSGSQFVTILVPRELSPGSTNCTIAIAGGGSTTVPVTIAQASPAIFTYVGANNQLYADVIKSNGTVAGPSNPATRGETVTLYLTGLPLTPNVSTNGFAPSSATVAPLYPVILGVANGGVPFTSVAYSSDLQGVETISFQVPSSINPGPVTVAVGVQAPSGTVYSQGATLNVQ